MKTAIIYASVHHHNTKKLVDALKVSFDEITLIDATQVHQKDLSKYDKIGFASGIYFSKFHQAVLDFAEHNDLCGKPVFLLTTYGGKAAYKSIEVILQKKNASIVGRFGCKGYDTFGPFKLVGGICKGHPNSKDIKAVVAFYQELRKK